MSLVDTRRQIRGIVTLSFGVCSFMLLANASALALDVVKIEEHWQLDVGGPESTRCAPQVSMVMSPRSDLNCEYFAFSLNHWSYPEFVPGGLEVQKWNGEHWVSSHHGTCNNMLSDHGEVVTWIQRMEVNESGLSFEVLNGQSETWGSFGGQGHLKVTGPTELTRLNDYRPGVSFDGSGIGYAGNRVSSLTLQKLVWWTTDGERHEMVAPIDIDTDIDPTDE